MSWNLKIFEKSVTLESVEPVRAMFLSEAENSDTVVELKSQANSQVLQDQATATQQKPSTLDQRIFEKAGWCFLKGHRGANAATAATVHLPKVSSAPREVFVTDSGALLIATDLATVKLKADLNEQQIKQTLEKDGLTIVRQLTFGVNLYEVRIPEGASLRRVIDGLQRNRNYLWAEPNFLQAVKPKAAVIPQDVEFVKQWQHRNTGRDADGFRVGIAGEDLDSTNAWTFTKGKGIRIAIIDSGMQIDHPDLVEGIVGGGFFATSESGEVEFTPLTSGMSNFPDAHHGTFCMGLAGARTNPAGQLDQGGCGVAPECALIAIACSENRLVTQSTLARAIHFAVEPSAFVGEAEAGPGADIISCSLDTDQPLFSVLAEAIAFAGSRGRDNKGVPIFWAVANENVSIKEDPVCCLPEVIAVGKFDRRGAWAGGARGPELAFLAPGVQVFSTTRQADNIYGSGTSFATPLAAGVGALVLALNPDLEASEVRRILVESCESMGTDDRFGAGKLNASKAVANAKASLGFSKGDSARMIAA